ncbi:unnamed protein product, partial [Allacma fusca]
STNTWEPLENLVGSQDAVDEFETRFLLKDHDIMNEDDINWGSDKILIRDVVSVGDESEEDPAAHIHYVIKIERKGQDSKGLELIASKIITRRMPQEVIAFLQSKIKWA